MAGYSGTPMPRKLGINPGARVVLLREPAGGVEGLTPADLPDGVEIRHDLRGARPFDVIVVFCNSVATMRMLYPKAVTRLATSGGLWVAWPKKASGVPTDLSDSAVRSWCLESGLVDNKTCAIDETWSGLRFVRRLEDRRG
ncbi:MAG: DUF3052 domain-containing protein [Phycisphaeraceae bacterium]|nr:MAG: DUF3052 domain-containing protein [Phycisphaeraceae bacterium]